MKSTVIKKGVTASIILGLGALLSACGGGGGSSVTSSGSTTTDNNVVTGYTKDGYFSASVYVYGFNNNSATLCNSGTSSSNGYFSISLNSCSGPYLVVATALTSSGIDAGTYYYLTNQPSNSIYVTPASTAIVEEYTPTQSNPTTVLSYFKSSSSLASIENLESNYNNSSISFTHISITIGNSIIEYSYPIVNNVSNTVTIPILVKEFSSSSGVLLGTSFGSFSNNILSLSSSTSNASVSLSSLSSLSNLTNTNIISVISPVPIITTPIISPTSTSSPITSSSSVLPISSSSPIITSTSSPITSPITGNAFSASFSTNIYEEQGTSNVPMITVYIDGQPVNLILDTGDSGLIVNKGAVPNIPLSSYSFNNSNLGPTYDFLNIPIQGVLASATVCLNLSITSSCVTMPIGVITSGNLFVEGPTEPNQGIFGLADISHGLSAAISNGSTIQIAVARSYPYYLEEQTGIHSYQLSFISLSNGYYANVTRNQPIGQISFGSYNENYNMLIPYSTIATNGFIFGASVTFGSYPNTSSSYFIFDTASHFTFLGEKYLASAIPNYSPALIEQENACNQYPYSLFGVVNSSYTISYTMQSYTGSFVTEPVSGSFCGNPPPFNLLAGVTIDADTQSGDFYLPYYSVFGFSAMLGHTFTYVLDAPGSHMQGIVQYLGISP